MVKKQEYKFAIGDRVALGVSTFWDERSYSEKTVSLRYDPDEELQVGEVIDVTVKGGKVFVKWDDYPDKPEEMKASELLPEAEAKKLYSKLEAEFAEIEDQVHAKCKEAAKAIREANKIAKKTGRTLNELYEASYEIQAAMDDAGWRTSSWGC